MPQSKEHSGHAPSGCSPSRFILIRVRADCPGARRNTWRSGTPRAGGPSRASSPPPPRVPRLATCTTSWKFRRGASANRGPAAVDRPERARTKLENFAAPSPLFSRARRRRGDEEPKLDASRRAVDSTEGEIQSNPARRDSTHLRYSPGVNVPCILRPHPPLRPWFRRPAGWFSCPRTGRRTGNSGPGPATSSQAYRGSSR